MFSTILLPIKDLLICLSFAYLYYYQGSNLKRREKKKLKGKKMRGQDDSEKVNRMSVDTDEVNLILHSTVED